MKHETILDISITFSKACWTCVHDVSESKSIVQRPLWQLFIRISSFLDASCKGEKQTPTFHVNLHENATIVGLLLLNPEKMKNVIILTSQSVKLLSYLYGNEFEGRNISRISQICPKFAKFCSRNVTLV